MLLRRTMYRSGLEGVVIFHAGEFNIFYRDKVKAPTPHCFFYLSTQLTVSYRRFSKRLPPSRSRRVRVLRIRGNFIRSRRHPIASIFPPRPCSFFSAGVFLIQTLSTFFEFHKALSLSLSPPFYYYYS